MWTSVGLSATRRVGTVGTGATEKAAGTVPGAARSGRSGSHLGSHPSLQAAYFAKANDTAMKVYRLFAEAPRPGLEPGAYSLGGSRSIHLSYRGLRANRSRAGL